MPLNIIRDDITHVKADAIVNTANPMPGYGGGTDTAIYHAAGEKELLAERAKIGVIERGAAVETPAFRLSAKYIIHTVGPVWEGGEHDEFKILENCYRNSLELAKRLGCQSIAFPMISTGTYGFPKDRALQIAITTISTFLMLDDVEMDVSLVVFDNKAFRLSRNLFCQVESYIGDEEVAEAHRKEYGIGLDELERYRNRYHRETEAISFCLGRSRNASFIQQEHAVKQHSNKKSDNPYSLNKSFDEHSFDKSLYMNDGKESLPFQKHLLQLIIDRNMDNAQVYKRSNVTKGAFSKIMCGDTKTPKKNAVLGFCIGLKLTFEEAEKLLASADMAFNPYDKRDKLIIQWLQ